MVKEGDRRIAANYFYDALGRRIAKSVNGEQTVFGWDGDTLAYESSESGTHYVYEAGSFVPLAQFVTASAVQGMPTPVWRSTDRYLPEEDPLQRVPIAQTQAHLFYYHCDHIGTPYMMTDELGEVVWEATYKAWGETQEVIAKASRAAGVVAGNRIRFQGQQVDPETGLHLNRHRYYDPAMGRYISADPVKLAGGINLYRYAPNPVQWADPLGLSCDDQQRIAKARARQKKMLTRNVGYNVSPTAWDQYPTIGRAGTFVTDKKGSLGKH